jgi:hypothetical protein
MGFEDLFDLFDAGQQSVPTDAISSAVEPAADFASSGADALAGFGSLGGDVANLAGANPSTFGEAASSIGPQVSDTASLGTPQGMPEQGSSIGGGSVGQTEMDPEQLARQGQINSPSGPNTPYGPQTKPDPHMWESSQKPWYESVGTGAKNELASAMNHPIATGAKALALGAPLIGAGISALNAPKSPGKYTLNPPPTPAQPLPGTTGTSSADIPAASPMSTTLTGQGGFKFGQPAGMKAGGLVPTIMPSEPARAQTWRARQALNQGSVGQPSAGFAEGGKVSDQDEKDYQEAMKGVRGPAVPVQKPVGGPPQQSDEDKIRESIYGKKPPGNSGGYFNIRSPWGK